MTIPHLDGLNEIAASYDYFLLDIFGLLHNGVRLNPGTIDCLAKLRGQGKKICLLSNTPKRSDDCANDLVRYGLMRDMYDYIVTAGESARVELADKYQKKRVLYFGTIEFAGTMKDLDLLQARDIDEADFILNSIPSTYKMSEEDIIAYIHDGAARRLPMICANPDLVVHIGDTLYKCAGTYAALYEQLGGKVSYHGKPYANVYDMAFKLLGNPDKSRVCALGDALHTDVRGACNYDIDSIWCLSGIHWEELRYQHKPADPDESRVAEAIQQSAHKPTAAITHFQW